MEFIITFIIACVIYIVTVYTISKELDSIRNDQAAITKALEKQNELNSEILLAQKLQGGLNQQFINHIVK